MIDARDERCTRTFYHVSEVTQSIDALFVSQVFSKYSFSLVLQAKTADDFTYPKFDQTIRQKKLCQQSTSLLSTATPQL